MSFGVCNAPWLFYRDGKLNLGHIPELLILYERSLRFVFNLGAPFEIYFCSVACTQCHSEAVYTTVAFGPESLHIWGRVLSGESVAIEEARIFALQALPNPTCNQISPFRFRCYILPSAPNEGLG